MKTLDQTSCQYLKGVGPRYAQLLEKCNIYTIQDVLFHLPFRYQDRTRITAIRQARIGEWVVIEGVIARSETISYRGRGRQFICDVVDNTGILSLRFFHITSIQKTQLESGARIRCFGELRYGNAGLTLIHPEYQILEEGKNVPIEQSLTPIYSSTEGLSQFFWRKVTLEALVQINAKNLIDYLPAQSDMMPLHEALNFVHRPPANADIALLESHQHPAQLRLAFEELLAHHLSLRCRREKIQQHRAPSFKKTLQGEQQFLAQLPFQLTKAQRRVIDEITQDLSKAQPMLRLIQGDVGSGKTIVAAVAALHAVNNNYQVALMAPTEILAQQHFRHFQQWFGDKVVCLSGQAHNKERKLALLQLENHDAQIVIGTHALFQAEVNFAKLGLVIIDEQHRFGVQQRLALREKGLAPHQLIMTATPIPRTLAMTMYADLNLSVIDELPPGRTPIRTVVINAQRREEIILRIKEAAAEKRQIYWVCPLIEESEVMQCQAAEATAQKLRSYLPELKIGLIHGRLKPAQKAQIMHAFKQHECDLLVATTVIEVGVDVPNASVMIIENAERLGLAQLHQLRGRVGRGSAESYCILLYQTPLSEMAEQRLRIMRDSQDGFVIAEKDLELRGPGELLGTRQTGLLSFRVADLQRDQHLFAAVQAMASDIMEKQPAVVHGLLQRWLGNTLQFQEV